MCTGENENILKGDIMGLDFDPTKYGMKDYAAEFKAKTDKQLAYNRGLMDALGIGTGNVTVPIGNTNKQTVDYETGWMRYTPRAFNSQQIAQDINFTNDQMQLSKQTVYTYRDGKKNKDAINAAVDEVTQLFIKYGTEHGKTVNEKDAKNLAKRFVENELNKENFLSTRTFIDEAAYKKAEQDREIQKKGLVSQYMREDSTLSKKDAERRADANLVRNQYLKNKGARQYIDAHKDYFYDEQGNLSQEKYKAAVLGFMNAHTTDDEVDNYRLSLNERYDLAAKFGINDNSMCDMVHRAGGGFQKDYKEFKQALIILLGAGVGYGAGALLNVAASTATRAAANAATNGAASSAGAAAGASVTIEGLEAAGAAAGGLAAANIRLKSTGEDDPVYGPKKPEPEKPEPEVEEEQQEEQQVCELTPDEFHDVVKEEVNYCSHTIIRGDDPYKIVVAKYRHEDGSKLSHAEALKVAHELKMIHGCTNYRHALNMKVGDEFRCYTEFDGLAHPELKGKKYVVDCDAETDGKKSEGPMKGKIHNFGGQYNGAQRERNIDNYWYTDCDNNRSNIFTNQKERDDAMAEDQARRNQAKK